MSLTIFGEIPTLFQNTWREAYSRTLAQLVILLTFAVIGRLAEQRCAQDPGMVHHRWQGASAGRNRVSLSIVAGTRGAADEAVVRWRGWRLAARASRSRALGLQ
jgi:hypothetical protein